MAAIERLGGQFAVERYRLTWQARTADIGHEITMTWT
jgi:hypothetical protein